LIRRHLWLGAMVFQVAALVAVRDDSPTIALALERFLNNHPVMV
jgi:hypothetical protein